MKLPQSTVILIAIILACIQLAGKVEFKPVETWTHDALMPGFLFDAVLDDDGDIVAAFQKAGVKVANARQIKDLGPFGQGPNDLDGFFTLVKYRGTVGIEGMAGKFKLFQKKAGKYAWKETVWKQVGSSHHFVTDGKFLANKWFFAGTYSRKVEGEKKFQTYFLRVYARDGKFIKNLVEEKNNVPMRQYHLMSFYLADHNEKLFFIGEDRRELTIVSPTDLTVSKRVKLEMPPFYKTMPQENYLFKEENRNLGILAIERQWAHWKTNYSRICRMEIDKGYLILQVRTAAKNLKRFALLFYRLDNLKPAHTIMTDDLLLAVKDGRFYLFENGNPGYDDDAGDFKIKIYDLQH